MKVKQHYLVITLCSVIALFGFLGCSDDDNDPGSTGAVTQEDREDVADDFGAALAGEDEGMLHYWRGSGNSGGPDAVSPAHGNRGTTDDTLIVEHGGFTVVRIRDYYDLFGQWYPLYDPLLTVRMDQFLSINGTHSSQSGNRTVTVDHDDQQTVVGIEAASDVRTVNGVGDRTVEGEFTSRFRQNVKTCSSAYHWVVTDVVFSSDLLMHPYPLSGSIAVDAMWTRTHTNPGRDFHQTVNTSFTVTFDGSRYAEVVMQGGARFWIDLENGRPWHERPGGG